MKKHVLLCNLAGELNIGSLRRSSALHSTFFLLMENISTSSGGSSCCCLHFARICFPLILSSDYSVFVNCIQREGKKKQQKGNLNIRQSFNPTTCADIFILLDCMYYYHGGGVILLGVNNVWRLRLLDF
ncbi:hypothetical protein MGM_05075 [Candida albicans P75063]|nr:hypothetical protein MGM_05075 [Candida albicans P75063]